MKNHVFVLTLLSTLVAKSALGCAGIIGAFNQGQFSPVIISTLSPDYLADHRVANQVVVPAASFLDAALTAARKLGAAGQAQLSSVIIRKPLILSAGISTEVKTEVAGDRIVISTSEAHMSGKIDSDPACTVAPIPPPQSQLFNSDGLYQEIGYVGLQYGPRFRTLRHYSVDVARRIVVGEIRRTAEIGEHTLHPTVIDGAFHALAAIQFVAGDGELGEDLYVPAYFGKVTYTEPRAETNHYFVSAEVTRADKGQIVYNLIIQDSQGYPILEIAQGRMLAFKL